VVLLTGRSASGARRWLSLGFSFQPSELMKLSFIIILARTLCYTRDQLKSLRVLLPFIFYLMIPFVLISKQPDLGTALTLAGIFLGMLLWAGLHPFILFLLFSPILSIWLRHHWLVWVPYILILWYLFYEFRAKIVDAVIFLFLNIGIAAGFDRLWGMLHDYQQRRILSFFNPGLDPFGSGYHALQSKIAVGSGGLFGRGFLQGSQTHYAFIPEQHTDFIFSVIGEEFGFVGSLVLLLLFGFLIWRLIVLAGRVKNSFASFVIIGVASLFTFHVLVNIGMAVGIMPVVGVPLPFLSYGGSALLVTFIALGIVQSIIVREEKLHF
jgi:rod shape determining protein RodA